ncbi:hypothetical protein ACKURH_12470 [Enterobacter soli]
MTAFEWQQPFSKHHPALAGWFIASALDVTQLDFYITPIRPKLM